jgi:predicted RNase H-like HicB family nuclease
MATKTIRIIIKEMIENGERYFLAESPDVSGFLAEADSLEEMVEIAPEVMDELIDLNNTTKDKNHLKQRTILKDFSYQFLYLPAKTKVRHLAYA